MLLKRKKIFLFLIILWIIWIQNTFSNTLIERSISWYNVKIIEYSINSTLHDIKVWIHPIDWWTLRSIMWEVWWITWINWIYQCPKDYSACGGKNYTINERYVNWNKKAVYKSTWDRVVFAWDKNKKPFLFQTDVINKNREKDIFEGFANHPLLLKEWIPQTEIYHEKGLIDYKMKLNWTRNFICSNKQWDKIFFWLVYKINIDKLALVLKEFWCYNAINLDAGKSTSFIYNWKYLTWPQREILDWVFIVTKGIDTKKIYTSAKTIIKILLEKIKNSNKVTKIRQLENVNSILDKLSKDIYKKNEVKIYEEKDWKKIEVWFRTEIKNKSTIKKIYLINILRTYTEELVETYNQIPEYKYIKKLDLKIKIESNIKILE